MTNWPKYNEALRRRGDLTVWVDVDALDGMRASGPRKRGGQWRYVDLAIEICLTLWAVFGLALRQVQGFVRSLLRRVEVDPPLPDFSTLCRRASALNLRPVSRSKDTPVTLIVDSTGLRIHGGRDWMQKNQCVDKQRKSWRNLHIALIPMRAKSLPLA